MDRLQKLVLFVGVCAVSACGPAVDRDQAAGKIVEADSYINALHKRLSYNDLMGIPEVELHFQSAIGFLESAKSSLRARQYERAEGSAIAAREAAVALTNLVKWDEWPTEAHKAAARERKAAREREAAAKREEQEKREASRKRETAKKREAQRSAWEATASPPSFYPQSGGLKTGTCSCRYSRFSTPPTSCDDPRCGPVRWER